MTIASADLLPMLDSLGIMANDLAALQATTPGAEIVTGAGHVADDILALTDISVVKDLATGASALVTAASAAPGATGAYLSKTALFSAILTAIQRHVTSLNTYLANNTAKVSKSFATLWRAVFSATSLAAANVFEDTHITLASWTYTGSGTGTPVYTGGPLDMSLVAPNQLELVVDTDIGASGTVSLTCQKADNSTEVKTVALTTADVATTVRAVGSGSDVYKDVTVISSTGGTSGAFHVRNKWPRTPAI
jgi:hypothetical protein